MNAPLVYAGLFGTMLYGYWDYKQGFARYKAMVSIQNLDSYFIF